MGSTLSGLISLVILALDIWAIINILKSAAETGMKIIWVLVIIVLPVLGLIIWLSPARAATSGCSLPPRR